MPAPVLLHRDEHLLVQLGDVAEPDLRAFARGSLGDRARERVHVPRGAVVDHGDANRTFGLDHPRTSPSMCGMWIRHAPDRWTMWRLGRVARQSATASQFGQRRTGPAPR